MSWGGESLLTDTSLGAVGDVGHMEEGGFSLVSEQNQRGNVAGSLRLILDAVDGVGHSPACRPIVRMFSKLLTGTSTVPAEI